MPSPSRPLSILTPWKFKTAKQTVVPASTSALHQQPQSERVPRSGGLASPVDLVAMAFPLDHSNGPVGTMQAYARAAGPDPVTSMPLPNGVSGAKSSEARRADTPHIFASRQAVVEAARIPVTKHNRFGSVNHPAPRAVASQPLPLQHPHAPPPMRRPRANSVDRMAAGIWSPSVLADSDFNSPFTANESHQHDHHYSHRAAAADDDDDPPPQQAWSTTRSSEVLNPFIIGENGMMILAPRPSTPNQTAINSSRHPGMMDDNGLFQQYTHAPDHHGEHINPDQNQYQHSSPQRRAKLPLREARPRRTYSERGGSTFADEEDHIRGPAIQDSGRRGIEPAHREEAQSPQHREAILQAINPDLRQALGTSPETPRPSQKKPPRHLLDSALPPPPFRTSKDDRPKKRRRNSCDYDDNALFAMNFADLQQQPFDFDPIKAASMTQNGGFPQGGLPAKLEQYMGQQADEQRAFFEQMSVDEWDRCGDWMAGQFSKIVQRLTEARQARRAVVDKFEKEISEREEEVRLKSQSIQRRLDKMKENGLRVVLLDDDAA